MGVEEQKWSGGEFGREKKWNRFKFEIPWINNHTNCKSNWNCQKLSSWVRKIRVCLNDELYSIDIKFFGVLCITQESSSKKNQQKLSGKRRRWGEAFDKLWGYKAKILQWRKRSKWYSYIAFTLKSFFIFRTLTLKGLSILIPGAICLRKGKHDLTCI